MGAGSYRKVIKPLSVAVGILWAAQGFALGTPSSTPIANNVTVDFELGGVAQPSLTTSVQFLVDNKIDLSLAVSNATVSPAQGDQVITFVLQNDGNSTQGYAFDIANSTTADNFDMNTVRLYVESGVTPGFQAAEDTLYVSGSGVNAGDVAADAQLTVYIVANVPPTGGGVAPLDAQSARYDLLVTTLDAGTNTATTGSAGNAWNAATVQNVFAEGAAGPHGADAINDGRLSLTAVYSVNAPAVSYIKSSTVLDPLGGSNPVNGATITYTLQVSVSGSGNVDNVVITDPIPVNTTYSTNSLTLNSGSLSDAADADAGDFNSSNANTITVNLGTLNNASGTQTITFAVTINP